MTAVGMVTHPERAEASKLAGTLGAGLVARGIEVRVPASAGLRAPLDQYAVEPGAFAPGLDFVVSLGGDGTMLHTVDLVYRDHVPVLGVNLGQLGYLADVEPDDLDAAVERVLRGDYSIEERTVVRVAVESEGPAAGTWAALNECLLEKAHSRRLVHLAVSIGGEFFTTYAADGMIVATPTGSTAYAFSARGPIISPGLRCLLLTPVSPHMLFDRSLVLHPDEEVRFEVVDEPDVELSVDGRTLGTLSVGDAVACRAGEWPARLIVFAQRHFHQTLKAKFELPDR